MNLPEQFLDNMKCLLGPMYDDFISCYENKSLSGLRVNRNKISVSDFLDIAPYKLTPIPYIENGFFINDGDGWSKHPYYFAGLYYLQEPSAMLPANRLPIDSDDIILDVCAAPGGKSTELSTKGGSLLISNDISYKRTIPLVKNLEFAGARNYYVLSEDPNKLKGFYKEFFNKILIDAPCSGEGMFRKDPKLIKAWLNDGPLTYPKVQKSICEACYEMLKPGGLIMYSTCTFSPCEDEDIIASLLHNHSDLELVNIEDYEGFLHGYSSYVTQNSNFSKCIHILPNLMAGEGHFLCLIKKTESDVVNDWSKSVDKNVISYNKLPDCVKEFLGRINTKFNDFSATSYIVSKGCNVYMLPFGYENVYNSCLRYVRTGNIIGSINEKGKFIPHTAFALSLDSNAFDNVLNFKADDINIIKYLKGETLIICEDEYLLDIKKGIVLICINGYGLGFASYDGCKFKKLYEKGWRLS